MTINVDPQTSTGNPTIQMFETTKDGATYTENQPYQFGSSNGFSTVTAKALPSGTAGVTDPEDPDYWKAPKLKITDGGSGYAQSGTIEDVDTSSISTTSVGTLFAPGKITRMFTEDIINNATGAKGADTKPDVIGIEGKAPGQDNITMTLRVKLQLNSVTGLVDMARYTIEARNDSQTEAYAYGFCWNVDTYIGASTHGYNGDNAKFQAPGVNSFSAGDIAFCFPNPGIAPWTTYQANGDLYKNKLPKYLYATSPDPANSFTATIYPRIAGGKDSAYPGAAFESPDYLGMGAYATIMTTSHQAYYYWKTFTGNAPKGADSGHMVRYDPRLLLPGQNLLFGVDYGQGKVGQAAGAYPYIQVDQWTERLQANAQKTGYDEHIEPNLTYGNGSTTAFTNGKLNMEIDNRYLEPDSSMTTGAGAWTKTSTAGNIETWTKDLGAVAADTTDLSVDPVVNLKGKPQYNSEVTTNVKFTMVTSPEFAGDKTHMTETKQVTLEKCEPVSLNGYVWRDVNNSHQMEKFEGIKAIDVKLYKEGNLTPIGTATSIKGGVVTGPTGITANEIQYLQLGELTGANERYTLGGIKLKVNGNDQSFNPPITAATGDPTFEILEQSTYNGKTALKYKIKPGAVARIEYMLELRNKAIVMLRPYAPDNISNPYDDSKKVEAGAYGSSNTGIEPSTANTPIGPGQVPVKTEPPAGSNVKVLYNSPTGYRHPNGSISLVKSENNVASWYPAGTVTYMDFPLVKGDVRISAITGEGGTPAQVVATDQETPESKLSLPLSDWSGKTADLDIRVWDSTATEVNPVTPAIKGNYSWSIVNNSDDILVSLASATGKAVFNNKPGKAKVKVTNNSMPSMTHLVEITVTPETPVNYDKVYITDANDATMSPLQETTVALGNKKNVYVVGVSGGNKTKIKNNSTALSFEYENNHNLYTVTPASGADPDLFEITGVNIGYKNVKPKYGTAPAEVTNVLVTKSPITASTRLKIQPDPVEGTPSSQIPVTYKLMYGGSGAQDHAIPAAAVTANLGGAAVGQLEAGNTKVKLNAIGDDTLTAKLKCDATKTDTVPVKCKNNVGPVTGKLAIREKPGSTTDGYIEVGHDAEYQAYIDKNDNGAFDPGDVILSYSDVTWTAAPSGKVTTAAGSDTTCVKVTGANKGVAKLTATYNDGTGNQTASTDVLVYSQGYTFDDILLSPKAAVIKKNGTTSFSVKAVFKKAGDPDEVHVLPESLYEATTELSTAPGTPDESIIKLAPGSKNVVTGVEKGQAVYAVKAKGKTPKAKVLVVPADVAFKVTPKPVWIEKGNNKTVTYELTSASEPSFTVPEADLLDYINANIDDLTIAKFDVANNIKQIKGEEVGRTLLHASLAGLPGVNADIKIYVYDGTLGNDAIKFNPAAMDLVAGETKNAQVQLMKGPAPGTAVATVDMEDLEISTNDPTVAQIPSNPTGNTLPVTAPAGATNGTTTVKAKIPGTTVEGPLRVTVTDASVTPVHGIKVEPEVIELWPGETKSVEVKDTLTGSPLNAATLALLNHYFAGAENESSINPAGKIDIKQTAGATAGINKLTLTKDNNTATVIIVNFTENPNEVSHKLELDIDPDPTSLIKGKDPDKDVLAKLVHKKDDGTGNFVDVDTINISDKGEGISKRLLKWRANTQSNLPGVIAVSHPPAAPGMSLALKGLAAGAAAYDVTYLRGNSGSDITVTAHAFVFENDPTDPANGIDTFEFEPDHMNLPKGNSAGLRAKIKYKDGTEQLIGAAEMPYAVTDLSSDNNDIATVSPTGKVRAVGTGTPPQPSADATVTGRLIDYPANTASASITVLDNTVGIHHVTYHENTGSGSMTDPNSPYPNNVTVSVLPNGFTAPANKVFDKWNTQANGTGTDYAPGDTFNITGNVDLYAIWKDTYTVIYDENGGSGTLTDPNSPYPAGGTVTVLANGFTAPANKVFDKWNTQANGTGTDYAPGATFNIASDTTLYAQWKDAEYTLTYNSNGGSGTLTDPSSPYVHGSSVVTLVNTFTAPAGKEFDCWNTQANGSGTDYTEGASFNITQDTVLYAKWKNAPPAGTYTVTYNATTGTGSMNDPSSPYNAGSTVTVLPNGFTAPAGQTFDCWTTAPGGVGPGTEYAPGMTFVINNNVTLYAKWVPTGSPINRSVTYDPNTGTGSMTDAGSPYVDGATVTVLANTFTAPSGKVFDGWNTSADGTGTSYAAGATFNIHSNVVLYAQWRSNTYQVTYHSNGGSGSMTDSNSPYANGASVTVLANTFTAPSGKVFDGWNTAANGSGTDYAAGATFTITADTNLYAKWKDITYTVTYHSNGGSGAMADSHSPYVINSLVTVLPNAFTAPSGKVFDGWNTAANGSGTNYAAGATFNITADTNLYAKWKTAGSGGSGGGGGGSYTAPTKYNLTYQSNGGTSYPIEQYNAGTTVTLNKVPTKAKFTFTGWYRDAALTEKIGSIQINGHTTVYAGWKSDTDPDTPTDITKLHIPEMLDGDNHFAYMNGYSNDTIKPANDITRAEVAIIFYRLLKDDVREANMTTENTFKDVTEPMWHNKAISTMVKLGVLKGRSAEQFDPNAYITRAEFAAICARFDKSDVSGTNKFNDINTSWAKDLITRAAGLGWINGYADGTFRPQNHITRAEAMSMVNKMLGRLPETKEDLLEGMKTWSDNADSAWYYLHVQEATNSTKFNRKADGVHITWTELIPNKVWDK